MSSTNPNGGIPGVGKRATTTFDDVFNASNNGPQPVLVWIDPSMFSEVSGLTYYMGGLTAGDR